MFGKSERELLWLVYTKPFGQWVHISEPQPVKRECLHRASRALERIGLVERALIEVQYAVPRRPRVHVKLTSLGRAFCRTFSTQLQSGARIVLARFEREHGYPFPHRRKELPPWLIPNQLRDSSRRPASMANQTAA